MLLGHFSLLQHPCDTVLPSLAKLFEPSGCKQPLKVMNATLGISSHKAGLMLLVRSL